MYLKAKNLLLNTEGAKENLNIMLKGTLDKLSNQGVEINEKIRQDAKKKILEIMYLQALDYTENN